jgi:hypothetical protein
MMNDWRGNLKLTIKQAVSREVKAWLPGEASNNRPTHLIGFKRCVEGWC